MKTSCLVSKTRGIPIAEFNGTDECEHCRQRPETESVELIIGLRRLVQQYQYYCSLDYDLETCPLNARACKMKIEFDCNDNDIKIIGMLEFGTHDIEFIYEDREDYNGSDDTDVDDYFDDEDP